MGIFFMYVISSFYGGQYTFFTVETIRYLPILLLLIIVLYYLIYRYNGKPIFVWAFIIIVVAAICIILDELFPNLELVVRLYLTILRTRKDHQNGIIGVNEFSRIMDKASFILWVHTFKLVFFYFLMDYLVRILNKVLDDFIFKKK